MRVSGTQPEIAPNERSTKPAGPHHWRASFGDNCDRPRARISRIQIGQHLDSHSEPRALQKLHEDYLRRVGAAWYNPQPFLKWIETPEGKLDCISYLRTNVGRDFARIFGYRFNPKGFWLRARLNFGAQWGWKEPRTTLFAPAWVEIFSGARIVHVVRDADAAASSIRERELKFQAAGDP